MMDPIGLAFENFDGLGQYRETEGGKTIDASGSIFSATEPALMGAFTGVRALATKLAASTQVRNCVAEQWFQFASGRNEAATDACSIATLQSTFAGSDGDLVELIVGMTQTDTFWFRPPVTQ
jgi:phospholipase/lecithinase/hemolysin